MFEKDTRGKQLCTGTLIPTTLKILTNTDQQWDMCSSCHRIDELALYFTFYYGIIHNEGRVYVIDRGYKEGDLTLRAIGSLGD